MIINPAEEVIDLEEDIELLETKIAILEAAEEAKQEMSPVDNKALEIYTEIQDLQEELLEFIEENGGGTETKPPEDKE